MEDLRSGILPLLDEISNAIERADEKCIQANARLLVDRMQAMLRALSASHSAKQDTSVLEDACRDGARMLAITGKFLDAADALRSICPGLRRADACGFALDEFLCRLLSGAEIGVDMLNYEQRRWALWVLGRVNQEHAISLDGWQTVMLGQYNNKR
jgi:hypothetical protein